MPARPDELGSLYVTTSSDENVGSDDVFQNFSEDGNEDEFFRLGIQKF